MLSIEILKQLLHQRELTNVDRLLLCMAVDDYSVKTVAEIKAIATKAGLRRVKSWNISTYLGRSDGKAIRTEIGWEVTDVRVHAKL